MRKKIKKIDYAKPSLEPLSGPSAVHASVSSGTTGASEAAIQWGCVGGPSAGTCPGGPSASGVCGPGGSTALDQGASLSVSERGLSQQGSIQQ